MPKFSAYMRGEGVKGDAGKDGTIGTISATSHISNFPEVRISTSGPSYEKNIEFDFGLVSGPPGGFSTNQNASIEFISVTNNPLVSITTDDTSPNNEKVFNFDFKIPEPLSISKIEQTVISTTSDGENEITLWYNDNSSTTFIIHNGAQGTPSFIQGAVSTTLELPDNNNYTGQAFLVGEDEENKKLYVYLENEWVYQGSISGAGFGEPTGNIEIVSFTTSKTYMDDKIITLEKTEENNLEIEGAKIYLQPVQDLHGYANPWPAGGGENLIPLTVDYLKSIQSNSGSWSGNDYTLYGITYSLQLDSDGNVIGIKVNGTSTQYGLFYLWSNFSLSSACKLTGAPSSSTTSTHRLQVELNGSVKAQCVGNSSLSGVDVATGSYTRTIIAVPSGVSVSNAVYYPMLRLATDTDATFAPYSNVCPITGHTEAVVTRTGINIWDEEWVKGEISIAGDDRGDIVSGNRVCSKNLIKVIGGTTYYIRGARIFWVEYDEDGTYIRNGNSGEYIGANAPFTPSADAHYIRFQCTTIYGETYNNDISINYPSTDHDYHAGDVASVTIDLGGTRYGCQVDVVHGLMTVDRVGVDMGNYGWVYVSDVEQPYFNYGFSDADPTYTTIKSDGLLCSLYPFAQITSGNTNKGFCFASGGFCRVRDTRFTDAATFKTAVSGQTLVYPLATPVTVQLDPETLSLLLGKNNIWTNAGILELDCSEINKPEIIVSVDPESPESAKIFNFDFKIPEGKPGEKGDTPTIGVSTSVTTLEHDVEPTVSISTLDKNNFRFNFGIPVGYTPEMTTEVSTTDLPSGSTATVGITTEQNKLYFDFGIPQGLRGETGASISGFEFLTTNPETHGNIYYANFSDGTTTLFEVPEGPMGYGYYQKLPFTSTNIEQSNQYTWIQESNGSSTLIINRTENDFIPVNIYNSTNNNIAATFTLATSTEQYPFGSIQYNTNEKFDGILYYIGKAPVPELVIGSVTTSSDGIASVSTTKEGYNTVLNFSFPLKGDKGDPGEKGADGAPGTNGKDGNGIASVEILSVEGLTTNYRITFTDQTMTPFDFSVRNGRSGGSGEGGGGIDEVDLSDDSIVINTLPINHGGTGASTSTQAWINLGGGDSGKHPEGYYLTSTDVIIPTLDFTDNITSISTESYAGTSTYVARGDHIHNLSLTTGDANGQIKIAGVNIDVKGLDSAAYSATTNYYPSTGGNIPTMSVGGGEKIDKISITNVDPGVGSVLAANNILFVYTGGGGFYTLVGDCTEDSAHECFIDSCPEDGCYNKPTYSNSCPQNCYTSDCFKNCFTEDSSGESSETQTVRVIYNDTYIIRADGTLVGYASANETYEVLGDAVIMRQDYPWEGVHYEEEEGYYYQIGEDQYIFIKALDTEYTCPANCFNPDCPTDNCFEGYNSGSCPDNCFSNNPRPGCNDYDAQNCTNDCYGGCYGDGCYGNCYGDDCYLTPCYAGCSNDGVCSYQSCPSNSVGCSKYRCAAFSCDKGSSGCSNFADTCYCGSYGGGCWTYGY